MLSELVTALRRQGDPLIHECRNCGVTLVGRSDVCPYCGPTEVATFELDE